MSQVVEFVGALTTGGWKFLYVAGVVALGFHVVSRGHKAAMAEQAEEARERRRDRQAA